MQADREPDDGYVLDTWWRRLPERPATAGLIATCVLAYAATLVGAIASSTDPLTTLTHSIWTLEGSEPILVELGALDLTRVWLDDEWWRIASAGLLHGFFLHLVLNVLALGSLGDWVEHAWGPWRTLLIFTLSSFAGCLASLVWCESNLVVGASAGVLGLAGALWVSRQFAPPFVREKLDPVSGFSLGFLVLLTLILGAVIPGIAQAGHLGGLAMGFLVGTCLVAHRAWKVVSITGVGVLLVTLVILGRSPHWSPEYHQFIGLRALADGDTRAATGSFQAALARRPDDAQLLNTVAYQFALGGEELGYAEGLTFRALEIEPTNPSFLDTLAWVLCRQGNPRAAQPLLSAALFLAREPVDEIAEHAFTCAEAAVQPHVSRGTSM